jgi:hypothetical protein
MRTYGVYITDEKAWLKSSSGQVMEFIDVNAAHAQVEVSQPHFDCELAVRGWCQHAEFSHRDLEAAKHMAKRTI